MFTHTHAPPTHANAGARAPVFRVVLCSDNGVATGAAPKFNKPLTWNIPFMDAANAPWANEYTMAVESFHLDHRPTYNTDGYSSVVVALEADGFSSPNTYDSVRNGPSRRLLTHTICMSESGFTQPITNTTHGIPVSLAQVFGKQLTLQLVDQSGAALGDDDFGSIVTNTARGRWTVTLVFYPRQ